MAEIAKLPTDLDPETIRRLAAISDQDPLFDYAHSGRVHLTEVPQRASRVVSSTYEPMRLAPASSMPEEVPTSRAVLPSKLQEEPTEAVPEKPALLKVPAGRLMSFRSREQEPGTANLLAPVGAGGEVQETTPGSADFYRNRLARIEDEKANPWGSAENHPGRLGKIGHVLARIGDIAGSVVAPAVMANIPGTTLNRQAREAQTEENLSGAERTEALKDTNEAKIDAAEQKLQETEWKNKSDREVALRKQGLKEDQNGQVVPIAPEDMSPTEKAVNDLKGAQKNAATARALVDQIKANPDSPQNQAIRDRLKIMARNAGTAAEKLNLDKKKFLADYFGTDENGNPLAGVQTTPEGKPIGPKVAGATQKTLTEFNKNYEKPANDVEKSYQMMNNAYNEYKAAAAQGKELPTGAQSMLALSTHLSTTFGNVKGARVTKDMIEHHLGARSVSDAALVAVQRLTNGDVLSPAQWEAFHDLIAESRKLSWDAAVKEAKRANLPINFLPADLEGEGGGKATPAAGGGAAAKLPPGWK